MKIFLVPVLVMSFLLTASAFGGEDVSSGELHDEYADAVKTLVRTLQRDQKQICGGQFKLRDQQRCEKGYDIALELIYETQVQLTLAHGYAAQGEIMKAHKARENVLAFHKSLQRLMKALTQAFPPAQ